MNAPSHPGRLAAGLLVLAAMAWGVLHAGSTLTAPPPLGAAWTLAEPLPCAPDATALTLSQSGVFLDVRWPGGPVAVLAGRLDGARVTLTGTCTSGAGTWTPEGLDARLTTCGPCGEIALRARRDGP
ncbi:MAG: hypothetical protein ACK4YP_24320 [Myxococcota bacterium]